jgi:hypothetical protein
MLDGTLLAVAMLWGWLCRSCLLERATLGRPKRVERPDSRSLRLLVGLVAGFCALISYIELNPQCFENVSASAHASC